MSTRQGASRLPIGIQGFEVIRTGGYAYVDKTQHLSQLVSGGKYYFLSRPRRFGKSLFVDTLDSAFSGRQELFEGLWLADHWDWTKKHPVLRVDWVISAPKTPEALKQSILELLDGWERAWEAVPGGESFGSRFFALVRHIHERSGHRVVVLVDEYDKPILDCIEDPVRAGQMRDILRDFYGALKPLDLYLEFVFLTGVSKFAKAGIFSGLNNLNDITLDSRYSAICGYTQDDLETVFAPWFDPAQRETVRSWYNGYAWCGERVYNPFDILMYFDKQVFRSFWFETGTPTFLVRLLASQPRTIPDFENLVAGEELLGSFDVARIRPETLLFQAGYLTVKSWTSSGERGMRYVLGFPNREVRQAFAHLTLELFGLEYGGDLSRQDALMQAVSSGDGESLRLQMHSLFASIPYEWYTKNPLARYEGFYASVVYAWFASVGWEVIPEDTTNRGRIDLTVKTKNSIWIFEFKVKGLNTGYSAVPEEKSPLAQIRERGYGEKYRSDGRPVRLVGVVFDPGTRQVVAWETGEQSGSGMSGQKDRKE